MNVAARQLLEAACRHLDERLLEQRASGGLAPMHKKAPTVAAGPAGEGGNGC